MSDSSYLKKNDILDLFVNKYGNSIYKKIISKTTPLMDDMKNKFISTIKQNLNYEIRDDIEKMYILYKIPGVDKKDISILVSKGKLIIKGSCNTNFHTFSMEYYDVIDIPIDTVNTDLHVAFYMGLLKITIDKMGKSNYIEII